MRALDLPGRPWIVGHRGVREAVPENTVASLREAHAQGADMVELDVQLSRDGHLVVYHDRSLPVDAGEPRPLAELSLAEIRRCRPLWTGGGGSRPYQVQTLAEILEAAPPGLPLNLEIKRRQPGPDPARLAEALGGTIGVRQQLLISSFDAPALVKVGGRLPDLPLAPLAGAGADWRRVVELARQLGAFSIHVSRRLAAAVALQGRLDGPVAAGLPVLAYTVNETPEARRLRQAGVAGFFTDHPAALRAGLEAGSPD